MAGPNPYAFNSALGAFQYPGLGLPPLEPRPAVMPRGLPVREQRGPYRGGARTALLAKSSPEVFDMPVPGDDPGWADPTYDYPGVSRNDPYGIGGGGPDENTPGAVFDADTGEFGVPPAQPEVWDIPPEQAQQPEVFDLPDPGPEAIPKGDVWDLPDPEREPRPGSPFELDPMQGMFRPESPFRMRGGFGPTPVLPETQRGPQGLPIEAKLAALGVGGGGGGEMPGIPDAGGGAGASMADGDLPLGRFRVVGPNGQIVHRGDLSGLGNPDVAAREKLGAAVEPLGDEKLVEIAKRLQGIVPDEQIPEYARKIWDAEQQRSGRMDVAKLIEEGKNARRGAGGTGAAGAPGSEEGVPKGWQAVNPAVRAVQNQVSKSFKLDGVAEVESSAKRALKALNGKAASQFTALKDLVKAYDGSRPTDKDVALVYDAAGKWEGLKTRIMAWNPTPGQVGFPPEFKAQLAEIFTRALKQAREKRAAAAAEAEKQIKELYLPILSDDRKARLARAGRSLVVSAGMPEGGAAPPVAPDAEDGEQDTDAFLKDLGY